MKKHKGKILVLFLAVLLVSVMSCENSFLKKMLVEEEKGNTVPQVPKHGVTFSVEGGHGTLKAEVDGKEINSGDSVEQGKSVVFTAEPSEGYVLEQWTNASLAITEAGTDKTYTHTVTAAVDIKVSFDAPFVEGGASLILSPDELHITVEVTTADNSPITVEGCTETTFPSGARTVLHAKGTRVILKGKITELNCGDYDDHGVWNKLAALNVQGLSSLQELYCGRNLLSTLNIQGLTALKRLNCWGNQLTELNVQGLTALEELSCHGNQLTALNVQGLTALKNLGCIRNQLTALDVQGLTALQ
ncbi:InlB B-repeat-containing protein, partial [Treponema denticola]